MKAAPVMSRNGTVAQVDEVEVNLRSMAAAPFVVKFAGHYKSVLGRRASACQERAVSYRDPRTR